MPLGDQDYAVACVIPVYNGSGLIRRSIDSALSQTYPPAEMIVVDDGSTDGTAGIVESYGPRVRYVRQTNSGVAAARNRGVKEAAAEWIAFLDHDDEWLPQKLERQVAALRANPDAALCYSGLWVCALDGTKNARFVPPADLWPEVRLQNPFQPSVVILRRRTFLALGGFDERLKGASCEDWEFFFRFLSAYPVIGVSDPLTNYYEVPTANSKNYLRMLENALSIVDGTLLSGLAGWKRARWRRRIRSLLYYGAAISARENHDPAMPFLLTSLLEWPLPVGGRLRARTVLAELRDKARGSRP